MEDWKKYGMGKEEWKIYAQYLKPEEEEEEVTEKEEVDFTRFKYSELKKLIALCKKDKKEKVLLKKLEKVEEYLTKPGTPHIALGVYIYNYEVDDTIIVSSTGDKYYK